MMRVIQFDEIRILHLPAGIAAFLLIVMCTEPQAKASFKPHLLQEEIKSAVAYQKAENACTPGVHPFHGNLCTVSGNHSGAVKKND